MRFPFSRRRFFGGAATLLASPLLGSIPASAAPTAKSARRPATGALALRQVATEVLDIGYYATGPQTGRPVVLVHDLNYDIHSYAELAKLLARKGHHVMVPFLRGHGSTRFKEEATPRSAQLGALGKDLIDFIDALHFPEAVFVGFGWGAQAAYAASVARPTRVIGVVMAGNGRVDEASLWHQFYFHTEDGRAELEANRGDIARTIWKKNSPKARFDEARFARVLPSFANPDHVAILTHAYRHRKDGQGGDPRYDAIEQRLAAGAPVAVPAITLQGGASGVMPLAKALNFSAAHSHRELPGVGHDLAVEAPAALAAAAEELVAKGKWRT
ncbi:hypothetical protein B0920_14975 [Massilia sp. KIM]|uniref:alpha/beta fold hydrolase n=1 Tax=Massilia sp. KIM TaxID=1955422 RepID=UPI00098F677A|nr:alpha/beta hydrolase [Massilia sp. KIM]OON60295.1 hypothetical protein B0920_14975 [Massilia sp. KIM]